MKLSRSQSPVVDGAIDDYLTDCAEQERDPDKPFLGKFVVMFLIQL